MLCRTNGVTNFGKLNTAPAPLGMLLLQQQHYCPHISAFWVKPRVVL
jgi:hypothetical protein